MPDTSSELVGGRYRVLGNLGKGAMGLVFMAYDPVLDRKVAIKQMTAEIADNEELRQRFYVEARAAARLNHPNIITIHELHESGGEIFIIMELLEGKALAALIQAKVVPLSLEATLDVMAQVCDGLDYAHQRAIVHRDIKPANLFLTPSGTVKVLDFGIARLGSLHMTAAGALIGTPDYMSPEQIRGDEIDRRTDLWAVGAVLYQLLSGTKPFEGKPLARLLTAISQTPHVPLQQRAPAIPKSVSDLVDRLLSKPRDARPASAGLVRDELRAILGRESASATKATLAEDEYEETIFMAAPARRPMPAPSPAAAPPVAAVVPPPRPAPPPPVTTAAATVAAMAKPVEMSPPGGSMAATAAATPSAPVTASPASASVEPAAVPSAPAPPVAAPAMAKPPATPPPPPAPTVAPATAAAAPAAAPAKKKTSGLLIAVIVILVVGMFGVAAMGGAAWWYFGQQGTGASSWLQSLMGKAALQPSPQAPSSAPATAAAAAPPPSPAADAAPATTAAPAAAPVEPPSARVEPAAPISVSPAPAAVGARPSAEPTASPSPGGTARQPAAAVPGGRPSGATSGPPAVETGVAPVPTARPGLTQDTVASFSGRQPGQPYEGTSAVSTVATANRINYVLEQYIQALVNADAEAIREYRTVLTPEESALMRARQLKVRLEDVRVDVNGNDATARCRRKVEGTSATGARIQEDTATVFHFVRRPSGWVITDVR